MFNYKIQITDPNFIELPERLIKTLRLRPGMDLYIQYRQTRPNKYEVQWLETIDKQNRVKICTAVWLKRQNLDNKNVKISIVDKQTILVRPTRF